MRGLTLVLCVKTSESYSELVMVIMCWICLWFSMGCRSAFVFSTMLLVSVLVNVAFECFLNAIFQVCLCCRKFDSCLVTLVGCLTCG